MMKKRLSKTLWYGTDVDSYGNPIIPSFTADQHDLDGLHVGELFLHYSDGIATLWTANESGNIVKISGGEGGVDLSQYLLISEFNKVWEIRTDSQGTEYIFGKLPVVTQYGITMYSGDNVDIPSIAEGLPFDGRTIWFNPATNQIEVIGGTGGGSGEGVSNFWDLSGIPLWITNTKPTYSYTEIQGTPDLSKYALVSDIPSLSGYATEQWVLGRGYALSSELGTKADKSYVDSTFVTINGTEDVIGLHDFISGLKIGGIKIYKSQDGVIYIDGNVAIKGGLTMYADDGNVNVGTIYDGLPIDNSTIYWDIDANGKKVLKALSVSGGGVADAVAWQNVIGKPSWLLDDEINYSEIKDTPDLSVYATQEWVASQEYLTGIDSTMVVSALGFTPYNSASFTKANIKSTLGISDWALAASKPSYKTSEVAEDGNLYFTNARAISALSETLKNYVSLSGTQTITGEKNFTGGLKVNGSPITYDKTNKYWKLEGDLLVTGGVTMYGNDSEFIPSTIMDAILYDDTTLGINAQGQLYVKGGAGGAITSIDYSMVVSALGYIPLQNHQTIYNLTIKNSAGTTQLTYTPNNASGSITLTKAMVGLGSVENTALSTWVGTSKITTLGTITSGTWNGTKIANSYLANSSVTISGTDVSLGGSISQSALRSALGLGSNAYSSTAYLPSANYTASDVLSKLLTVDGSGSGLDADMLDGVHLMGASGGVGIMQALPRNYTTANQFFGNGNIVIFDPAPTDVTGWGAHSTVLSLGNRESRNHQLIFSIYGGSPMPRYRRNVDGVWSEVRTFAFLDDNVASATKLQTARTIWGQSFDGTGNVDGALSTAHNNLFISADGGNTQLLGYSKNDKYYSLGYSAGVNGIPTHLYGGDIRLYSGTVETVRVINGNVGIGTPNPTEKLQVDGNIRINPTNTADVSILFITGTDSDGYYDYKVGKFTDKNSISGFGMAMADSKGSWAKFMSLSTGGNYDVQSVNILSNLLVSGGTTMYSARKLKTIQDERGLSLDELSVIKPTRFTWKDGRDNKVHIGGIADDVMKVLPEVIYKTGEDDTLTMDYGNAAFAISASLIKPVVNHEERIRLLEEENKRLKEEFEQLKWNIA